jgi:RHS repeat-associated protein
MSSLSHAPLCRYSYNALDQLIGTTITGELELRRFYCENRLASEIHGTLFYSFLQHEDKLLAQQQGYGEKLDATLLGTDLQRSVLHTVNPSGQRLSTAYSPYGHSAGRHGCSSLGFNGERRDPTTGHYLLGLGYRAYNPALMRFNSPDTLGPFRKGGVNSYAYCTGDPVNFIDPSGHSLTSIKVAIKQFFSKPKMRNVPAPNSLEGLDLDSFQMLSQYLDQASMDSLARVSHRLHDNSVATSRSNLIVHLERQKRNNLPVMSLTRGSHSERGYTPTTQGVGSAGYKMLNPEIKGPQSLNRHIDSRNKEAYYWLTKFGTSADRSESLRLLNVTHIDVLVADIRLQSDRIS